MTNASDSVPRILQTEDGCRRIEGPPEKIQVGEEIEVIDSNGGIVNVIPGEVVKYLDDCTVIHDIKQIPTPSPTSEEEEEDLMTNTSDIEPQTQPLEPIYLKPNPDPEQVGIFVIQTKQEIPDNALIYVLSSNEVPIRVISKASMTGPENEFTYIVMPVSHPVTFLINDDTYAIQGPISLIREMQPVDAISHVDAQVISIIPQERIKRELWGEIEIVTHRMLYNPVEFYLGKIWSQAALYVKTHDAHIWYYNGPIDQYGFDELSAKVDDAIMRSTSDSIQTDQRTALLILTTLGGDPDIAYKCARLFLRKYNRFEIIISEICKSAGTLLAIGAHKMYISEYGELGPMDIQIPERDQARKNIGMESSAIILSSLDLIAGASSKMLIKHMAEFAEHYPDMTLSTRSDIATRLTSDIFRSIAEKIDPLELGRMNRYLQICEAYGTRLARQGGNIGEEKVKSLVYDYPAHGFVIDREEGSEIHRTLENQSPVGLDRILRVLEERSMRDLTKYIPYTIELVNK